MTKTAKAKTEMMKTEETNDTNLPAIPVDPLETLRQVAAAEGAGATLLKFTKGDWKAGPDGDEMEVGTRLVVSIQSAAFGWRKWVDGEIEDERLVSPLEGRRAEREELGDLDKNKWPAGPDGNTADPWSEVGEIVLADPLSGDEYRYSTSSFGGRKAIAALLYRYSFILCVDLGGVYEVLKGKLPGRSRGGPFAKLVKAVFSDLGLPGAEGQLRTYFKEMKRY